MHLQSGEQFRFALPHLQLEQSPLQEHLTSSLHDRETSGIVIHTGTHDSDTLVQAKSAEKEPLDVTMYSLSRLLLDTLPVGYAGVEHPWLVAVCPLLGSYDRRVPSLPRLRNSKDWSCHRG